MMKNNKKYFAIAIISLVMIASNSAYAQEDSQVLDRANEVAGFVDKNTPEKVKTSISTAKEYLESKRIEINNYANQNVTKYVERPAQVVEEDEGFSSNDVKEAFATLVYYLMLAMAFVSSSPYVFWTIVVVLLFIVLKRLFR